MDNTTDQQRALPAADLFAFEVVDASDDETYWPLGLYLNIDDAITASSRPPDEWGSDGSPEDGEYARIEIKRRKIGWDSWGGKAAWSQEWSNEAVGEEYQWVPRPPKMKANEGVQPAKKQP